MAALKIIVVFAVLGYHASAETSSRPSFPTCFFLSSCMPTIKHFPAETFPLDIQNKLITKLLLRDLWLGRKKRSEGAPGHDASGKFDGASIGDGASGNVLDIQTNFIRNLLFNWRIGLGDRKTYFSIGKRQVMYCNMNVLTITQQQ